MHEGLIKRPLVALQPAIIGTFPAIYELMPRERHRAILDQDGQPLNIYDVNEWEKTDGGY